MRVWEGAYEALLSLERVSVKLRPCAVVLVEATKLYKQRNFINPVFISLPKRLKIEINLLFFETKICQ